MKEKISFRHEHFKVDFESQESFLVIVELVNFLPVSSYIVKVPNISHKLYVSPYSIN